MTTLALFLLGVVACSFAVVYALARTISYRDGQTPRDTRDGDVDA